MVKITAVKVMANHRLELTFSTGETKCFDVTPYLDKGFFTELNDPAYFAQVRIAHGTVTWPNEQDFGPDSLYVEAQPLVTN